MSRFNLRPYQSACVESVLTKFRERGKLLASFRPPPPESEWGQAPESEWGQAVVCR